MTQHNNHEPEHEEESFAPEEYRERREREEYERMQRRMRREIILVNSGAIDDEIEQERQLMEEEEEERRASDEMKAKKQRSIWSLLTTGSFLTSTDAHFYYRFLIAIAIMCFVSIFLTFMSLNAERECHQLEDRVEVLRERSIIFDEKRYGISTKSEVERLLEQRGIVLIDLSNDSRIVEK